MEISNETNNAINSLSFQINYEFRQVGNEVDAKFILVEYMRFTTIVMFGAHAVSNGSLSAVCLNISKKCFPSARIAYCFIIITYSTWKFSLEYSFLARNAKYSPDEKCETQCRYWRSTDSMISKIKIKIQTMSTIIINNKLCAIRFLSGSSNSAARLMLLKQLKYGLRSVMP